MNVCMLLPQSWPTLCEPMDCSLPGSPVRGILQAKILEWLVFPSPRDRSDAGIKPGSPALQADSLPSEPPHVIFKIYSLNMFQVYNALLLITINTLYLGSSEWINLIAGSVYPSTKISPFPQSPAFGNYFLFFFSPQSGVFIILFIYLVLAVLGLLCCMAFSSCSKQELFSSCSAWASHCSIFSYCRARAFRGRASVVAARILSSCSSRASRAQA